MSLPVEFIPSHVHALTEKLRSRSPGKLVILLDEIDNLLRWDQSERPGGVREAFFRECRALSQEDVAQFVFSGERLIATKLWDPASPHWNFCRPIAVRQLTSRASASLFTVPFESLGVTLLPLPEVVAVSWRYTNGHPQILQELGNRVVHELNTQAPERRSIVSPELVEHVAASGSFARHYIDTYWGQATPLEKLVSILVAREYPCGIDDLRRMLADRNVRHDAAALAATVRMLTLYGIMDDTSDEITIRAEYFRDAILTLGGTEALIDDLLPAARAEGSRRIEEQRVG